MNKHYEAAAKPAAMMYVADALNGTPVIEAGMNAVEGISHGAVAYSPGYQLEVMGKVAENYANAVKILARDAITPKDAAELLGLPYGAPDGYKARLQALVWMDDERVYVTMPGLDAIPTVVKEELPTCYITAWAFFTN